MNPQFRLKLHGVLPDNVNDKNIFVAVMQKSDKRKRHMWNNLHIGFTVFEVKRTCDRTCGSAKQEGGNGEATPR